MTGAAAPCDVRDKVVVITGATGVLGSTYCEAFATGGARVVLVDLAQREPAHRAAELEARHAARALGLTCDVGVEDQVKGLAARVVERFGRVDVVINNAAATSEFLASRGDHFGPFETYPLWAWDTNIRTNLTGPFLVCREFGETMKRAGGGSVVNVCSIYGLVGPHHEIYRDLAFRAVVSYSASKAGVLGLTRWLASYWAKDGIRVNAVTPGGVHNDQDPEFVRRYVALTPMGRMADRGDLAGIMLFLASDASSYCTGQNFIVDGGWTAW
jgi:NAD(P)-dependent dehydrogenase (short-subunit alcohol dehydrogenase family)